MMRIDQLNSSADRSGRYRVVFSDGSVLRLYRQTVEDFGLYTGMELSNEEMHRLQTAAGEMSAKMRAVRIISASGVSKRDLEQRLIYKGEAPEDAHAAVQWLGDLDLLDDQKTAQQIVERCIYKGYGPARAKQALYEKRIPKDLWDEVLADYPDQKDKILEYLHAKLPADADDKDVKRVIDALLRRGHSYSMIRRCLDLLPVATDDLPEE